jgi:hypothetical protein
MRREFGEACTAVVTYEDGHRAMLETSYGTRVDNASGWDFNGDGSPEFVLESDLDTAEECCTRYIVLTLKPKAEFLFDFTAHGSAEFRRDNDGITLWAREGVDSLDRATPGPTWARRVFRYAESTLADVTSQYCDSYGAIDAVTEKRAVLLQQVFCGQADAALVTAKSIWPGAAEISRAHRAIVAAFPEYKTALSDWP